MKTYVTTTTIPQNGPNRTKVDSFWYKVKIGARNANGTGWVKYGKAECNGQLFCDVMPFSQAMKDRIDLLGFQHKLWAKGADNIESTEVLQKPWGGRQFVKIQNTPGRGAKFYSVGPDSCVDMLFVNQPPASFPDNFKPPMYCLGRCENPAIINTGL